MQDNVGVCALAHDIWHVVCADVVSRECRVLSLFGVAYLPANCALYCLHASFTSPSLGDGVGLKS